MLITNNPIIILSAKRTFFNGFFFLCGDIMAVPFRRTSKTKKRMRRTHLKKTANEMIACPNCGAMTRPHRAYLYLI